VTARKSAKKRESGGRVYPEPKPGIRLPEPGSECSTPELASELSQGVKAVLRRLGRKREDDDRGDPPGPRQRGAKQ
jgi:hypothetical protein